MDKPKATPKDFFMWAGAMLALWGGVVAYLALVFDYINYTFPDVLNYYYSDPYSSISYEMASLIVLAPVLLILMRLIRRDIVEDPSRNDIWVRRWALMLTLFAAGATIVVDLIILLTTFLSGEELSIRFLLKVVVVLLVAAAGFMHFLADLRGYWNENPKYARRVNYATAVLVIFTVAAGFFIVGTPQAARQYRFDEQRINSLQQIQGQIVYYWQQKEKLPQSLTDLTDDINGFTVPTDPSTGALYEYRVLGTTSFELCATFAIASRNAPSMPEAPLGARPFLRGDNWGHEAGRTCFTRTIDKDLYPPVKR